MGFLQGEAAWPVGNSRDLLERGVGAGKVMEGGGGCGWMVESEWGKEDT